MYELIRSESVVSCKYFLLSTLLAGICETANTTAGNAIVLTITRIREEEGMGGGKEVPRLE